MNITTSRYQSAREQYARLGVDADAAMEKLLQTPISLHCWQGDDVQGFEGSACLDGGIQATGDYPGRAKTPRELMADMEFALNLIPGRHRINLHASYAVFTDTPVDRDKLEPRHFAPWVQFAKRLGVGIDFNPTFFAHPKAAKATLSSEDEDTRAFWIRHGVACLRISEYFARELGTPCTMNIWIPDGFKDTPADRTAPRARLKDSLDQILSCGYNRELVRVTVESKVFGIGLESYTVGSQEFYLNYAAKNNLLCLLDSGHFHPTEMVADKLSSMLLFQDQVALHVSRPVRWDSDHVVIFDDTVRQIAREIAIAGPQRVILALDFFDASINRIAAWVIGMRSMQKALLEAYLTPFDTLARLQDQRDFTQLLMLQEELKTYPLGDVWDYFCQENAVPVREDWYSKVKDYERDVLSKRESQHC